MKYALMAALLLSGCGLTHTCRIEKHVGTKLISCRSWDVSACGMTLSHCDDHDIYICVQDAKEVCD